MTNITSHTPSVTPYIYRLSDELLWEIFLYCCRQSLSEPLLTTDAPLNVAGVSSHWRRVALSIPRLWTCISYQCSDHRDDADSGRLVRSLECCKAWLERSGAARIRLHVTSYSYIKPFDLKTMDLFVRHRYRIIEVQLFLSYSHLIQDDQMGVMMFRGLPRLERLTISYTPTRRNGILTVDLSHLHNLLEVVLLGNIRIADITLPLLQLKHFTYAKKTETADLTGPALLDALPIMDKCPVLEEVHLRGAHMYGNLRFETIGSVVCAQSLRRLSLVLDRAVYNGRVAVLDLLSLPKLEDAEFHFQRATVRNPLPDAHSILSLFQRSNSRRLRRLSIGGGCIDDTDLLAILRLSPTITCLELMCHVFADLRVFLERLTLRPNSTDNLCPDLETLVLFACPWGASGLGMADMITSRSMEYDFDDGAGIVGGKLRRVYLQQMGYMHLWEDEAILECVNDAGLDLLVK